MNAAAVTSQPPSRADDALLAAIRQGDALAFERRVPGQGVLVAVNAGSAPARIPGLEGQDLLSGRTLSGILPAWSAAVLER